MAYAFWQQGIFAALILHAKLCFNIIFPIIEIHIYIIKCIIKPTAQHVLLDYLGRYIFLFCFYKKVSHDSCQIPKLMSFTRNKCHSARGLHE